jgi:ATP-dependent Clp protease ATP-binding subunit ClpB
LIGAPPGYVGYDEGGQLTEAVRRRPYSVVLFDEIEKAHPEVFNVLLQLMDDGRLTDGHGRTVDFKNTIIIMTSNLGSQYIIDSRNEDKKVVEQHVMQVLRENFKPEFLNRVDDIVIFNFLEKAQIRYIVDIQIERLNKSLAAHGIKLKVAEKAKDLLGEKGFDVNYGARPLKRAIQTYIQNPLSMLLLQGKFQGGDIIEARKGKSEELEFFKVEK